eukprot:748118-Hanusia_phi.AAC.4
MFLAAESSNISFMSQSECTLAGRSLRCTSQGMSYRNEVEMELASTRSCGVLEEGHGRSREGMEASQERLSLDSLRSTIQLEAGETKRKVVGRRRSCCVVPPLSKDLIDQFYSENDKCSGQCESPQVHICGNRSTSCPCTPQSEGEQQGDGVKKPFPSSKGLTRRDSLPSSLARRLSRTNEEYDIPVLQILSAAESDDRLKGILERLNTLRTPARCEPRVVDKRNDEVAADP